MKRTRIVYSEKQKKEFVRRMAGMQGTLKEKAKKMGLKDGNLVRWRKRYPRLHKRKPNGGANMMKPAPQIVEICGSYVVQLEEELRVLRNAVKFYMSQQ